MNDRVGQQFGNYRLLRLLGQGDSSETYLGEHVSLKMFAAIKIWRLQLASQAQENFYSQARVLERLSQPNILPVLEHGMERETPFLIMQYAPNGSLRQRYRRGSILPPEVILPYVKQIAAGLRYAHEQNIIHRNIKPENLLLGPNNEILLSDFGIFSGSPMQQASNVTYTAPEQTQGRAVPASDQYSLAVVIYEWLTGSVPFNGSSFEVAIQHERVAPQSLREKIPSLSRDVDQVVLTALSKDPQRRFGSITAFATALEQATSGATATLTAAGFQPPPKQPTPLPPPNPSYNPATPIPNNPPPINPMPPPYRQPSTAPGYNPPSTGYNQPNTGPSFKQPDAGRPSMPGTFYNENEQQFAPPPPIYPNPEPTVAAQPFQGPNMPYMPPPAPPPQAPPPRRGLSTGMRVLLLVVAALVILSGAGLIFYATVYHPNQLHAQATGTAQAILTQQVQATATQQAQINATATGQANATSTAIAVVTQQAQATQTALQNIYTQATSGNPALSDPLANNGQGHTWDEGTGSSGDSCAFTGGAYHVVEPQTNFYFVCFADNTSFANFAYQVKMNLLKGDGGGLLFRGDRANFRTYRFGISQDGFFYLNVVQDSTHSKNLISDTSSAIHTGRNQTNLLTVIARGGNIYLYINQLYVANISDASYGSGQIGVFAEDNTSPTEVAFSNAQVWTI